MAHQDQQQHAEDTIGVLKTAGLPAKLQGKEHIAVVRLGCGPRLSDAVLEQHGA